MSYFFYTDLISSLLDPRLVDPGSTFDLRWCIRLKMSYRLNQMFIL